MWAPTSHAAFRRCCLCLLEAVGLSGWPLITKSGGFAARFTNIDPTTKAKLNKNHKPIALSFRFSSSSGFSSHPSGFGYTQTSVSQGPPWEGCSFGPQKWILRFWQKTKHTKQFNPQNKTRHPKQNTPNPKQSTHNKNTQNITPKTL